MRLGPICVVVFVGFLGSAAPAAALSILGQFLPAFTGPDNSPAHGGGDIQSVFDAAAAHWEQAILDTATVTIPFGWTPGTTGLGFTDGTRIFISSGHDWFVDPTPDLNEEYGAAAYASASIDGTSLNYSVNLTGLLGAAVDGYDLLTVMLHEIGHMLSFGPNFFIDDDDGDIDVTAPRPLAGLALPLANGCCHLDTPPGFSGADPLLFPTIGTGERRLISDADLLLVAQGGEWEQLDPARFAAVPEPGTLTLFTLGAVGLAWRRRARR